MQKQLLTVNPVNLCLSSGHEKVHNMKYPASIQAAYSSIYQQVTNSASNLHHKTSR